MSLIFLGVRIGCYCCSQWSSEIAASPSILFWVISNLFDIWECLLFIFYFHNGCLQLVLKILQKKNEFPYIVFLYVSFETYLVLRFQLSAQILINKGATVTWAVRIEKLSHPGFDGPSWDHSISRDEECSGSLHRQPENSFSLSSTKLYIKKIEFLYGR